MLPANNVGKFRLNMNFPNNNNKLYYQIKSWTLQYDILIQRKVLFTQDN